MSRTIPIDLDTAWDFLVSETGLTLWLGSGIERPLRVGETYTTNDGTIGEVRSIRTRDRVRLTWQPTERAAPATVQIALTPSATGCTFRFHTERLASSDEREAMRTHWQVIADRIEAELVD